MFHTLPLPPLTYILVRGCFSIICSILMGVPEYWWIHPIRIQNEHCQFSPLSEKPLFENRLLGSNSVSDQTNIHTHTHTIEGSWLGKCRGDMAPLKTTWHTVWHLNNLAHVMTETYYIYRLIYWSSNRQAPYWTFHLDTRHHRTTHQSICWI